MVSEARAAGEGVGFAVAEEAGDEALEEEEADGEGDGEREVGLGERVAEAGKHERRGHG